MIPEMALRIDELKNGFLSVPEVIEHFREPPEPSTRGCASTTAVRATSWRTSNLYAGSRTEGRTDPVEAGRHSPRSHVLLARFYISLDVESRLEERRKAAMAVFDALENGIASKTFATLLRYSMVDSTDLSEEIYRRAALRFKQCPKGGARRHRDRAETPWNADPAGPEASRPGGQR